MLNRIMTKHSYPQISADSPGLATRIPLRKSASICGSSSSLVLFRSPLSALRSSGFTLTELLVAIALLVIIMLSVSTVFRSSGNAVSAGLATLEMNRRLATCQTTFQGDISGFGVDPWVPGEGMWEVNADPSTGTNPPFMIIRNQVLWSHADRSAWFAAGCAASPTDDEHRYRTDMFGFFARGVFKRQTGGNRLGTSMVDSWPLITDMWGLDRAYIWYGHLRLPNNDSTGYYNPGSSNPTFNPNNFFPNQWILGRVQIALVDPVAHPVNPIAYPHYVPDLNENPIYYYGRPVSADTDPDDLVPFSGGNSTRGDNNYSLPGWGWEISQSRFDVAGLRTGLTWSDYATIVNTHRFTYALGAQWIERKFKTRFIADPLLVGAIDWSTGSTSANRDAFAANAARHVPTFMPGCTQFIVEFAGDYVRQAADSTVAPSDRVVLDPTNPTTFHLDDVIDFDVVDADPNTAGIQPVRRIHWYGMPRDVNGNGSIEDDEVTTVYYKRGLTAANPMPFENVPNAQTYDCGWTRDMLFMPDGVNPPKTLAPQLIRITIQITDAEGRVQDGMTRQYVFPVKRI